MHGRGRRRVHDAPRLLRIIEERLDLSHIEISLNVEKRKEFPDLRGKKCTGRRRLMVALVVAKQHFTRARAAPVGRYIPPDHDLTCSLERVDAMLTLLGGVHVSKATMWGARSAKGEETREKQHPFVQIAHARLQSAPGKCSLLRARSGSSPGGTSSTLPSASLVLLLSCCPCGCH